MYYNNVNLKVKNCKACSTTIFDRNPFIQYNNTIKCVCWKARRIFLASLAEIKNYNWKDQRWRKHAAGENTALIS